MKSTVSPPRTVGKKVAILDVVAPVPILTKLQKALLDLIAALCYEGLPCTKEARYRDGFPVLVPNEYPTVTFKCSAGVPTSFLLACTLNVRSETQMKLWGVQYPDVTSELRYFADRRWVDSYAKSYRPMLGAFINPFDSREIASEIVTEPDLAPGFRIRWYVTHGGMRQMDATVRADFVVPRVDFVKLTPAGHAVRETAVVSAKLGRRENCGAAPAGRKGPGRPIGSRSQESPLDRFVRIEATLLQDCTRLPIKGLIQKFQQQSGIGVTYEKMRSRLRTQLDRR